MNDRVIAVLLLLPLARSSIAADAHHFNDVHQALSAARASAPLEAEAICRDLASLQVLSADDVRALYDELKNPRICPKQEPVANALGQCGDDKYHGLIAGWLSKEKTLLPDRGPGGAYNARSSRALAVREHRLLGLLAAAGAGRNREALPVLRAMLKKGGVYSGPIAVAIGRIGDPADLEEFVASNKRGRGPKYDLSGFGVAAIDRIMKDVDDPAVSTQDKESLIGYLATAQGHDTLPRYEALLHHKNSIVAKLAAEGVARVAEPRDAALILGMLKDDNPVLRRSAIAALRNAWDDKHLPAVLAALKKDEDAAVRSAAAECLGARRACAAAPDLRAALNDDSRAVEAAAAASLKSLYNRGVDPLARSPHPDWPAAKVDKMLTDARSKKKEWQKFAALAALARSGYPVETVPALSDVAANGTDSASRVGAVELLRQIGGDKAKDELTKALSSSDPWLRRSAADALGNWIGECGGKPEPSPAP
ncbi:MAG: HEAT repeat domain-containing protein [Elusimicrobiota bacterium]